MSGDSPSSSSEVVLRVCDANDFYGALGISRDATIADIKAAYKRTVKHVHPDKVMPSHADATSDNKRDLQCGHARASEAFRTIKAAFDILRDTTQRHSYDVSLQQRFTGAPKPKRRKPSAKRPAQKPSSSSAAAPKSDAQRAYDEQAARLQGMDVEGLREMAQSKGLSTEGSTRDLLARVRAHIMKECMDAAQQQGAASGFWQAGAGGAHHSPRPGPSAQSAEERAAPSPARKSKAQPKAGPSVEPEDSSRCSEQQAKDREVRRRIEEAEVHAPCA